MLTLQCVSYPLQVVNQMDDAVAGKSVELRPGEPQVVRDLRVEFSALFTHGLTAGVGREPAALSVTDNSRGPER